MMHMKPPRKKLGQERIKIIEEYATNYEKLDSKKATDLITKKFAWADKYTKFQQSYFTKFSAVIGGLQAAKFIQLEDYIENCIRLTIQEEIPFIGELDKSKTPIIVIPASYPILKIRLYSNYLFLSSPATEPLSVKLSGHCILKMIRPFMI